MSQKIDILGSIRDAIKEILQLAGGMMVVGIIFGCLVAPVFSVMIESAMLRKNGQLGELTDLPIVERKMRYVNAILWIIAISSWALLIGLNFKF